MSTLGPAAPIAMLLAIAISGCGSAIFYDEEPERDTNDWVDAPAQVVKATAPDWVDPADDDGRCAAAIAASRKKILLAMDSSRALSDFDRERCLSVQVRLLGTVERIVAEGDEAMADGACGAAARIVRRARSCFADRSAGSP